MLGGMLRISPASSRPSSRATRRPPSSLLPLSTRSCEAGRPTAGEEKPGQTLQATALVHEAYLRLVGPRTAARRWTAAATSSPPPPRRCAASSSTSPRASGADKRGGGRAARPRRRRPRRPRPRRRPDRPRRGADRLARQRPRRRPSWSKLRYFAGLRIEEAAACLGISAATADRHWALRPGLALRRHWPRPSVTVPEIIPRRRETTVGHFSHCSDAASGRSGATMTTRRQATSHLPGSARRSPRRTSGRRSSTGPAPATRAAGRGRAAARARTPGRAASSRPRRDARPPLDRPAAAGRAARHGRSAPTSCCSRSAKAAWASSSWPSRRSPSAARSP